MLCSDVMAITGLQTVNGKNVANQLKQLFGTHSAGQPRVFHGQNDGSIPPSLFTNVKNLFCPSTEGGGPRLRYVGGPGHWLEVEVMASLIRHVYAGTQDMPDYNEEVLAGALQQGRVVERHHWQRSSWVDCYNLRGGRNATPEPTDAD
jgi:hypothetical protein